MTKLVNEFSTAIKTCSHNENLWSIDNSDVETFLTAYKSYKLSVLKIIKNDVRLIRGNLCGLCVDPAI